MNPRRERFRWRFVVTGPVEHMGNGWALLFDSPELMVEMGREMMRQGRDLQEQIRGPRRTSKDKPLANKKPARRASRPARKRPAAR